MEMAGRIPRCDASIRRRYAEYTEKNAKAPLALSSHNLKHHAVVLFLP